MWTDRTGIAELKAATMELILGKRHINTVGQNEAREGHVG
jgi:hypothetical protein